MAKRLLILGCSDRKRGSDGSLPAIDRYDGPAYRILRKFFREVQWPQDLSIGVLSAKYGLIGVLKGIENYNLRMSRNMARQQAKECSAILRKWANDNHSSIHISLGKDYLPAVQPALDSLSMQAVVFPGPIGMKNRHIKTFLNEGTPTPRIKVELEGGAGRFSYFLPDWDDLLDPKFDFSGDEFSGKTRAERGDKHCAVLMQPHRMSDGVLVSLAQHQTSKGPLRKLEGTEASSLAPTPLRQRFGLSESQYLFGDPGAFSYVGEDEPTVSIDQAIALYEAYGFDFGASVDHIPVVKIGTGEKERVLTYAERQERVDITRANAEEFIGTAKNRKVGFTPVGTIQGLNPEQYSESVRQYYELGYRHLAIGGLVPLRDDQIKDIVTEVMVASAELKQRPWIHLFGIFRPKLQALFRELKVDSFDSASYFRKAWLRSDQNYLDTEGDWYAAIRVPMTRDGRTRKRLSNLNADLPQLEIEERNVLDLLGQYDRDEANINEVLDAVLSYDSHLARSSETKSMREKYQRTLEDRPWTKCQCTFCKDIGIHMLIFRGANRNKRRGAHNTLMLYGSLSQDN